MLKKITLMIVIITLLFSYIVKLPQRLWNAPVTTDTTIALTFDKIPHEPLKTTIVEESWVLHDNVAVQGLNNEDNAYVRVYKTTAGKNLVLLIIDDASYDLDFSFAEESQSISVKTVDANHDKKQEIMITSNLGSSVRQGKLYAPTDEGWTRILDAENLTFVDLNQDGTEELLTESMGSLPGYVYIYRWDGKQFERADIGKNVNSVYAALITIDYKTLIEADWNNTTTRFAYSDGTLTQVE